MAKLEKDTGENAGNEVKISKGKEPKQQNDAPKQRRVQEYVSSFWSDAATPILFTDRDAIAKSSPLNASRIVDIRKDEGYQAFIRPSDHLVWDDNEQCFYAWNGHMYVAVPIGDRDTGPLARLVTDFIEQQYQVSVKRALVSEILVAITKKPARFFNESGAPNYAAMQNGKAYDLRNFKIIDASPDLPIRRRIDVDPEKLDEPTPVFDAFLKQTFPHDPTMIPFLVSMMGYYLIPHDDEPACFFLFGAAASGKSTILNLMREMIGGRRFIASSTIKELTTDKFVTANLAGKLANIYDEDESGHLDVGKLKALISHTPIDVQRKFEQPFTLTPYAKFLFASNQLPQLNNMDKGMHRRWYPIEFKHSIAEEKRDKQLLKKLMGEFSGIVGKALRAAQVFVEKGQRFDVPKELNALKDEFLEESNPALLFFNTHYEPSPVGMYEQQKPGDGVTSPYWQKNEDIYAVYKKWSEENGKQPFSSIRFFQYIAFELPHIVTQKFGKNRERFKAVVPVAEAAKMIPSKKTW